MLVCEIESTQNIYGEHSVDHLSTRRRVGAIAVRRFSRAFFETEHRRIKRLGSVVLAAVAFAVQRQNVNVRSAEKAPKQPTRAHCAAETAAAQTKAIDAECAQQKQQRRGAQRKERRRNEQRIDNESEAVFRVRHHRRERVVFVEAPNYAQRCELAKAQQNYDGNVHRENKTQRERPIKAFVDRGRLGEAQNLIGE